MTPEEVVFVAVACFVAVTAVVAAADVLVDWLRGRFGLEAHEYDGPSEWARYWRDDGQDERED
jgi:hypothetical protein